MRAYGYAVWYHAWEATPAQRARKSRARRLGREEVAAELEQVRLHARRFKFECNGDPCDLCNGCEKCEPERCNGSPFGTCDGCERCMPYFSWCPDPNCNGCGDPEGEP